MYRSQFSGAGPRRSDSEAHLPTKRSQACEEARIPQADEDASRSGHSVSPPAPGSSPAVGLIWRIRDRATFAALRARGCRSRAGAVTVAFLADGSPVPRVAFAISKAGVTAVKRNRVRRRARALLAERAWLPAGAYLVKLHPEAADMDAASLAADLDSALAGACQVAHEREWRQR